MLMDTRRPPVSWPRRFAMVDSHPAASTVELFRDDAHLREWTARVVSVDELGVRLDRTVFYPPGGGRAGERGALVLAGRRRVAIVETRKGEQADGISHMPALG